MSPKGPPPSPAGSAAASTPSGMAPMNGMPQMGEAGCPMAKGYLTTVVRKLDILTGDVGITLTADQAADIGDCLSDVETPAKMSNGDAMTKSIDWPTCSRRGPKARLRRSGFPSQAATGPQWARHAGMMGGGAAPKQGENQAPFPRIPKPEPSGPSASESLPRVRRRGRNPESPASQGRCGEEPSRKVITLRYSGLLLRNNEPGLSFSA